MCDVLAKLMRRFMKTQVFEKKYGSDLASVECKDLKLQLTDKDIVIGDSLRKALKELSSDQRRNTVLGICHNQLSVTEAPIEQPIPKTTWVFESSQKNGGLNSIINSKCYFCTEPKVNETEVTDKWKVFQVDNDLPAYDPKGRNRSVLEAGL